MFKGLKSNPNGIMFLGGAENYGGYTFWVQRNSEYYLVAILCSKEKNTENIWICHLLVVYLCQTQTKSIHTKI